MQNEQNTVFVHFYNVYSIIICSYEQKEKGMLRDSRAENILELVNSMGSVSVYELAKRTYASPSTIRRDLEKLEAQGLLRRRHGSAESVLFLHPPQIIRSKCRQTEKRAAAERAAKLVTAGSTIFMDASTTVQYMIPYLCGIENLTVYTNGVDTAIHLARIKVRAICTGGELHAESMAYVGASAADMLRKVYFDAMFFSSAAFDEAFVSDWSEEETELRCVVTAQSKKRYFLADPDKRGKRFTHIVCALKDVDEIFCE